MRKIVKNGNLARGKEKNFGGVEEGLKEIKCNLWNGVSWLRTGAYSKLL
jgi:hypothetical protein